MAIAGNRMIEIDGLRAFAVAGVLFSHYWTSQYEIGHIGVRLFFVISGYVITDILLRARAIVENRQSTALKAAGRFFIRRALRIFPAYYALLLLAVIVNIEHIRDVAWWHAAQLSNILFSLRNDFVPGYTAHYWSLSIEEQFYLVWPLSILLVPRRFLGTMIAATVLVAVLYRSVSLFFLPDALVSYYLTPVAFDSLGVGAVLAVCQRRPDFDRILLWTIAISAVPAIVIAVLLVSDMLGDGTWAYAGLLVALLNLPLLWLVRQASRGMGGLAGMILAAGPVVYLGRISYGIYLYHLFVLEIFVRLLKQLGIAFPFEGPATFLICSTITIAVAALSWHFLEQPFNRLKGNFEIGGKSSLRNEPVEAAQRVVP
jgi:peptidoglycan/LPS O-acetylase OafA/YrhL